uniref:Thiamine thiazole synthase n=1 Tax=Candidatus Methanophaga sp. ANME-1 ERB7 TaxID=2759913 RepID=A0A7G9Z487_9EURY|nr:thiamine thiazole synthase [Methanosarcinales archaeon ANME-1 ERB7]
MQENKCDVLVVGAGPAGCSAARVAAEAGAHTIFIDKKKEIGVPVQCAEAVGEYLSPYLPYNIPEEQLIWKIDGMLFWAEDITIERSGGIWSGYAINRKKFDTWLAANAAKSGAQLLLETELIDLEFGEKYHVTKAIVKTGDGIKEIEPKVIIAADGVHSKVLNKLGFTNLEDKCVEVLSFELNNVDLYNPTYEQLYLGDFAPGAYGYIFPLSKSRANVGVGSLFQTGKLEDCYEEFLEVPMVKKQLKNGKEVMEKSGWAPIQYLTDKWDYGNILVVGDAANQNFKPFVEGVLPGIICGNIAGQTASEFVFGKAALDDYPNQVKDKLGSFFLESDLFLNVLYELSKSPDKKSHLLRLGISAAIFSPQEIEKLRKMDYASIKNNFDLDEFEQNPIE